MSTRGRLTTSAATRQHAAGGLGLILLLSGTAVGSAHDLATVSSPGVTPSPAPSAASTAAPVAPVVSLSRWDTAVALGDRPGVARPLRQVTPSPVPVPPAALSAYQRAAAVLAEAAPRCELDWSLLAAVGHVESDHGERRSTGLDAGGVSHPAIVGPAIAAPVHGGSLPDTDGGELDGRTDQDRAVGPMQLLPSVWSAAAVDGDGDGRRDPQDIDDAALAAGVLLCTAAPGLGSTAGRREALRHYNAAPGYVDLVERVAAGYALTDITRLVVDEMVDPGEAASVPGPRDARQVAVRGGTSTGASGTTNVAPASTGPEPVPTRSLRAQPKDDPPALSADPAAAPPPAPDPESAEPPGGPSPAAAEEQAEPDAVAPPEPASVLTQEGTSDPDPAATAEPTATGPSEAADSPEPTPSAATSEAVTVTGVWTTDEDGRFLLDDTVVDVEALGDLTAAASQDLDGDGLVETVGDELEGLAGTAVEVVGAAAGPDKLALGSLEHLRRVTASP